MRGSFVGSLLFFFFFFCFSACHPTFRFCLYLCLHGQGFCGGRRRAWSASPGWERRCSPPARPDRGGAGGARAGGGAVPARGRASTPARAAADPPESTVVIHRPFSEMMPARGRGEGPRSPGVQGNARGTGHPVGGRPRGSVCRVCGVCVPALRSEHPGDRCPRPGATEAFSARKGF